MTKPNLKISAKFPGQKEYDYFMLAFDIVNNYVRIPQGHAPITEKQFAANCCMFYAAKIIEDFKRLQEQQKQKQQGEEDNAQTESGRDELESVEGEARGETTDSRESSES